MIPNQTSTEGFTLEITKDDSKRIIEFSNPNNEFVEVVFLIDGKNAKDGKQATDDLRGYGYAPGQRKALTQMKNGEPLPFGRNGKVQAIIYAGNGTLKDTSYETPSFIRRRIGNKITFKRFSNKPSVVIEVAY